MLLPTTQWSLRFCISNSLPGMPDAVGPGITFGVKSLIEYCSKLLQPGLQILHKANRCGVDRGVLLPGGCDGQFSSDGKEMSTVQSWSTTVG